MTEADAIMLKSPSPTPMPEIGKPEQWLLDFVEQQDAKKGLEGLMDSIKKHIPNPCPFIRAKEDLGNMTWKVAGRKIEVPSFEVGLSWDF